MLAKKIWFDLSDWYKNEWLITLEYMIVYYILAIYNSHMVEPTKRKSPIFLEYLGPTNNNSIFCRKYYKGKFGGKNRWIQAIKRVLTDDNAEFIGVLYKTPRINNRSKLLRPQSKILLGGFSPKIFEYCQIWKSYIGGLAIFWIFEQFYNNI